MHYTKLYKIKNDKKYIYFCCKFPIPNSKFPIPNFKFPQFLRIRISGSPPKKKTSKKYTFSFSQNKTLLQNPENSKIA